MDTAGIGLKEPQPIDWDNYNPGSKYQAPPVPVNADGSRRVFTGQLPGVIAEETDRDGFRSYLMDPIKLVKNGGDADGYVIRFTRASIKNFEKNGVVQNASPAGNVLKSVGVSAKPQKTFEYDAAFKAIRGRVASFTLDWFAKDKNTGEMVRGYENFPDDPERPGQKKAILKTGDTYKNADGQQATVKSEVLFANAQIKYFVDTSRR